MESEVKSSHPELKKLGDRIRELRKRAGFSSAETFANHHKLSRTQYGRWEKGTNITYLNLLAVANAHGLTLEEFFKEGFKGGK